MLKFRTPTALTDTHAALEGVTETLAKEIDPEWNIKVEPPSLRWVNFLTSPA